MVMEKKLLKVTLRKRKNLAINNFKQNNSLPDMGGLFLCMLIKEQAEYKNP